MTDHRRDARFEQFVLCVDDDAEFIKSLEFFLPEQINRGASREFWYRFLFFTHPLEALEALRELVAARHTVAMLISDQKMPQMKGTQFLAEARVVAPDGIRVLLTGHAGIESAIAAINDGLLDKYLTKPIENEHDFTVIIQHLLERFAMRGTIAVQTRTIRELYAFSNTLYAKEGVQDTLDAIADFTRSALPCVQSCVVLRDAGQLRVGALAGMQADAAGTKPLPIAEPQLGALLAAFRSSPGNLCDRPPWPGSGIAWDDAPTLTMPALFAALASGDQLLGVLCAGGLDQAASLPDADRSTLTYIANTASIALHNQLNRSRIEDALAETREHAVALSEANARLQILDRLKSDFLAFISHELRTPLNLMSAVELLDHTATPAEQQEMVRVIREGYGRLEGFIAKGLEYFDWFAATPVNSSELTDLGDVVRAAAAGLQRPGGSGVTVQLTVPAGAALARIARKLAEDVVRTLTDNALKFSDGEPWVGLELEPGDEWVTLTVSDRGRGFRPEWAPELLRPFTIADTMHHHRGFGLSLARAAAVVEAHGGRIRARSEGPGQGASFTLQLPGRAREFGLPAPPPETAAGPEQRRAA